MLITSLHLYAEDVVRVVTLKWHVKLHLCLESRHKTREGIGLEIGSNLKGNLISPKLCSDTQFNRKRVKPNKKGPKKIWVPKSQIVLVADILNKRAEGFKLVPGQWMLATYDMKLVYVPRPQTK